MADKFTKKNRFQLHRDFDPSGVSGTGVVADGVIRPDGVAVIFWRGDHPSLVFWPRGMVSIEHVNCHGGDTRVVWLSDDEPDNPYGAMARASANHLNFSGKGDVA